MKNILLYMFIVSICNIYSFSADTVKGKVFDRSGVVLPFVKIEIDGKLIIYTLNDGSFSFSAEKYPCELKLSHIAYNSISYTLNNYTDSILTIKFESEKLFLLNEVVVTATKNFANPEKIPQPASTISKEEVDRRFSYNAGEMLDIIPGVRIIRSGGTVGAEQGVSIRSLNGGPGSDKTLVMVDGLPMNNSLSGSVNFNALPTEMIERIEVVKGPSSALYGSQATAGVVNIITKTPKIGWHHWFSLSNEFDYSNKLKSFETGYGRPKVRASNTRWLGSYADNIVFHQISLGYRNAQNIFGVGIENEWKNFDAKYSTTYNINEKMLLKGRIGYHWDEWNNMADATQSNDIDNNFDVDIGMQYNSTNITYNARFYMLYGKNENKILSTSLQTGSVSKKYGIMTDILIPFKQDNSILRSGFDANISYADVDYTSTVINMNYVGIDTVVIKGKNKLADTFFGYYGDKKQSYKMNNIALYIQYEKLFYDKINFIVGVRYDNYTQFGNVVTPKIGIASEILNFNDYTTNLKINYGVGFRAPSIIALYSKSLGGYGNISMVPEKVKSLDIGIFQRFNEYGFLEISWYKMNVANLMVNDKSGSTGNGYYVFIQNNNKIDTLSFNQRKNLGSYCPSGVEISCKIKPLENISLFGGYTYLNPQNFTFQTSKYRWHVGLNGSAFLFDKKVEAEIIYNYTGNGYFFDYFASPFNAFRLTDVSLSVELVPTKISIIGKNIFDTKYRLWHNFWQPGRTIALRLESNI